MTSDLRAFDALKDDWDALAVGCPNPTQQHDWLAACARSFHHGRGLHVVTVTRAGRLVAAAPLAPTPSGELEPLGMRELWEPSDLLARDAEALGALARTLAREGDTLLLRRVPAGSPAIEALARAYALRGTVQRREAPGTPTIALGHQWTQPEGGLSSRWRSAMRRARRRAAALGELEIDLRAPGLAEVDGALAEALAVEGDSWRARQGTTLAADAPRGMFMREYARRSAAEGRLRIGFLRLGGQAAAMQIAVELDRRLWLLKIAYADRFGSCSPGSLLLLETLRAAAARGLRSCELLGESERWTHVWTRQTREIVAVRAQRLGLDMLRAGTASAWRMAGRRLASPETAA